MSHDESILMNEVVKEANIDVGGHVNCGSYLIIAKNTINYNIQQATYQYIPPKFLAPKNLAYDSENQRLKWDAYPYLCVPRIYYVKISIIEIECHGSMLINRNFTIHNWYILDNNNHLECKVFSFIIRWPRVPAKFLICLVVRLRK
ncbi:hypothetical protein RF11_11609 [Thelohanellus kitauei]|uniref:Uncharacterized protein n=1 Tax=Thelohanellus kitauei TaxID=669202 RepID=A0A0C2MKV1_THEKT|nr:hypothetical protein RF11_11609 [Thelohanellus kitauei]